MDIFSLKYLTLLFGCGNLILTFKNSFNGVEKIYIKKIIY